MTEPTGSIVQSGPTGDGRVLNTGLFAKGWKGGPGNPHGGQIARWRSAMVDVLKPDRMHSRSSR